MAASLSFDVPTGVLTITGDATANAVTISDISGTVYAADNATLLTIGTISSASVKRIDIDLGDNNDIVNLTGLNDTDFSGINQVLSIIGGAGIDTFYSSNRVESFNGGTGNDTYIFSGAYNTQGSDYISDSSGSDTVDFSSLTGSGITADLASGSWNIVGTTFQVIGLIYIENVLGTSSADTITGNNDNNSLNGGAGNDTYAFTGSVNSQGSDTLTDASGSDTLNFSGLTGLSSTGVSIDFNTSSSQNIVTGSSFNITSISVTENVVGTSTADTFIASSSANTLNGGAGNDTYKFTGAYTSQGSDSISDSAGTDTLDFSGITGSGVTVNLTTGSSNIVSTTFQISGTTAMENIIGTGSADSLTGSSSDNVFQGNAGSDTLIGAAGNDTYKFVGAVTSQGSDGINDSSGIDLLDFSGLTGLSTGVDIQLYDAAQQDIYGASFYLTGVDTIDNVLGTYEDDLIDGNALNNSLNGGAGDDEINASSGNDVLIGGLGNDDLRGNNDNDIYWFDPTVGDLGYDTVFEATGVPGFGTRDLLDFRHVTQDLTITLNGGVSVSGVLDVNITSSGTNSIEAVVSGSGNDTITGTSVTNYIYGGDGNDLIKGSDGSDVIFGGNGTDTLEGGIGDDSLWGGDGDDYLYGGTGNDKLLGENGNDQLSDYTSSISTTEGGNDYFEGGSGNDSLTSYSGDDTLDGGFGNDTLTGGEGGDKYYFQAFLNYYAYGSDTIVENGSTGTDKLDFEDFQAPSYSAPSTSSTSLQTIYSGILSITLSNASTIETVTNPAVGQQQVLSISVDEVSNPLKHIVTVTASNTAADVKLYYSSSLNDVNSLSSNAGVDTDGTDGWIFEVDKSNFTYVGTFFTAVIDGRTTAGKRSDFIDAFWEKEFALT